MDNSFDKLNSEFADKARGGFKYWFYVILTFVFVVLGTAIGVASLTTWAKDLGPGQYLSLLTLLAGLFGLQAIYKAKGTQGWNGILRVGQIASFVVLAFSCVVLYIVLPYVNG